MSDIFETGINSGNYQVALTRQGLRAVSHLDWVDDAALDKAASNVIFVPEPRMEGILSATMNVGFKLQKTIKLSDVDWAGSLHNAPRTDVALDPKRVERGVVSALAGSSHMPPLVLWKQEDGSYKALDGVTRYAVCFLLGVPALWAYVVECEPETSELLLRSINAHGGFGQTFECSVGQALAYLLQYPATEAAMREHVAKAFRVGYKHLAECLFNREFLQLIGQLGLLTKEMQALCDAIILVVRTHTAFRKPGAKHPEYSDYELRRKAQVLAAAAAGKLSSVQVRAMLDELAKGGAASNKHVEDIVEKHLASKFAATAGAGAGVHIGGTKMKPTFPLPKSNRFAYLLPQLLALATEMPDGLAGVYLDSSVEAGIKYQIIQLINQLKRLK